MTDKRNYEWPDASTYNGYITQDKSGGVTERVSVAQVEARLVADGFAKTDQIPNAADAAPADLASSAATGASSQFAREDHAHKKPSASDIGAATSSHTHAQSDVAGLPTALTDLQSGIDEKLNKASPTVASGKLTLAPAVSGSASLNIPTRSGAVTAPVKGDVQSDGANVLVTGLGLFAGRILGSLRGASDTFTAGSCVVLEDDYASPTKGWTWQLGASNTLDLWNYSGGWTRKAQIGPDGSIQSNTLSGTGTRPIAADSTGKLVFVAKPDYFHGSWTSAASTLTDITDWSDPLVDEAHYKCFAAGKLVSSTATETRFRFIIGGVSTSTIVVYSKGDWSVSFDVTTIGGSGASVCAVISSYGSLVTKHFELSSLSYVSAIGIRLQIASDDDNAQIQGLCTRLERLQ